mmetsp:Transcript_49872/g.117321  ORF Transcript_49872/g.117321 Transcript_49872/m.117321 type:complete len:205 (+) Transcript_49872:1728-2342(+)
MVSASSTPEKGSRMVACLYGAAARASASPMYSGACIADCHSKQQPRFNPSHVGQQLPSRCTQPGLALQAGSWEYFCGRPSKTKTSEVPLPAVRLEAFEVPPASFLLPPGVKSNVPLPPCPAAPNLSSAASIWEPSAGKTCRALKGWSDSAVGGDARGGACFSAANPTCAPAIAVPMVSMMACGTRNCHPAAMAEPLSEGNPLHP